MKQILTVISLTLSISPALGQWQQVDEFQQWSDGDIITEPSEIGWNSVTRFPGQSELWMIADPYAPYNICMYVDSGLSYQLGWNEAWVSKELPNGGIAPGEVGTLFFKCLLTGPEMSWHIGTASKPLAVDPEPGLPTEPGAWEDFNAQISMSEEGFLVHQDGDQAIPTSPPIALEANKWYWFWLVIENTWDESTTPPTSTGVYTLYAQGPGIGDLPTLIPVGSTPAKGSAFFSSAPADEAGNPGPVRSIMLGTDSRIQFGCPSCGDVFLLDEIYFTPGKDPHYWNKGDPWWEFVGADQHLDYDSGDLLGWINIRYAPIVWVYSISSWVYTTNGPYDSSWMYFYK